LPERRTALAVAVARDGRPKYRIAAQAHVNASDFSGYLTGRLTPTDNTRRRIAAALGVDEQDIFPEPHSLHT
jgi:hypothetical protein